MRASKARCQSNHDLGKWVPRCLALKERTSYPGRPPGPRQKDAVPFKRRLACNIPR